MKGLRCPFCGNETVHNVMDSDKSNTFMLVSANPKKSFSIPPNGIIVNVRACTTCGSITLGSEEFIGKTAK